MFSCMQYYLVYAFNPTVGWIVFDPAHRAYNTALLLFDYQRRAVHSEGLERTLIDHLRNHSPLFR